MFIVHSQILRLPSGAICSAVSKSFLMYNQTEVQNSDSAAPFAVCRFVPAERASRPVSVFTQQRS